MATRKLFTDLGLVTIGGSRSVVLNGIANAIVRPDLADRTLLLPSTPIKPEQRLSETAFRRAFAAEHAVILGALLDVVAHGLKRLPGTQLSHLPRLADFALWGVACETAYTGAGAFMRALEAHAVEAVDHVVENDPIAVAIMAFMQDRVAWTGTSTALLIELTDHDRAEAQPSSWRNWPKDPPTFGKALANVRGTLRKSGIEVTVERQTDRKRTRLVELRHIDVPSTEQRTAPDSADGNERRPIGGDLIPMRQQR